MKRLTCLIRVVGHRPAERRLDALESLALHQHCDVFHRLLCGFDLLADFFKNKGLGHDRWPSAIWRLHGGRPLAAVTAAFAIGP